MRIEVGELDVAHTAEDLGTGEVVNGSLADGCYAIFIRREVVGVLENGVVFFF